MWYIMGVCINSNQCKCDRQFRKATMCDMVCIRLSDTYHTGSHKEFIICPFFKLDDEYGK